LLILTFFIYKYFLFQQNISIYQLNGDEKSINSEINYYINITTSYFAFFIFISIIISFIEKHFLNIHIKLFFEKTNNKKGIRYTILFFSTIPLIYLTYINLAWFYTLYQQNETIKTTEKIIQNGNEMIKEYNKNYILFNENPKCKTIIDSMSKTSKNS
jgi:hypothetical protein